MTKSIIVGIARNNQRYNVRLNSNFKSIVRIGADTMAIK